MFIAEIHIYIRDQHGPQMITEFQKKMHASRVHPVYTPADCTDCVAPVDHHVGARVKTIMGWLYHAELEEYRDLWSLPPDLGGLQCWQRRVKMATWLAVAWSIVRADAPFLRAAFVSTGFLTAKDGSEDYKIKIPTVPDYSIN